MAGRAADRQALRVADPHRSSDAHTRNRHRHREGGSHRAFAGALRQADGSAALHRWRAGLLPRPQGSAAAPGGAVRRQGSGLEGARHRDEQRRGLSPDRSAPAGRARADARVPRRRAHPLRDAGLHGFASDDRARRRTGRGVRGAGGLMAARRSAKPKRELKRVLVANRGEIAVRVIRTLRELGMTSIAIFSEPDREALHVLLADEAYPVGPGPSRESYLNQERVLEVTRRAKADAVHPGYGFFAENAAFARGCAEAGVVFVGPAPETIERLGDKLAAREAAQRAGVPMVPASPGALASAEAARAFAGQSGFPLMLKAAAGGGGKGMRVVRRDSELKAAWELARGEAGAAFGDDRLYAERYLERPRHVEAQILADHERVVFLGERDCSVQRRHQKLFEETP